VAFNACSDANQTKYKAALHGEEPEETAAPHWFALSAPELRQRLDAVMSSRSVADDLKNAVLTNRRGNGAQQVAYGQVAMAVAMARSDTELPSTHQVRAVALGTQQGATERTRRTTLRIGAIGPIVTHQGMYVQARMHRTYETVDVEGRSVRTTKAVTAVYGERKVPRFFDESELRRILLLANELDTEYPSFMGAFMNRQRGSRARGDASVRAFPADLATALTACWESGQGTSYDEAKLKAAPFPATLPQYSDAEYVLTELHRKSLGFERIAAVLTGEEGFSAGCLRCFRRFYEPKHHYVVDAYRTAMLQAAYSRKTMATRDMVDIRRRITQLEPELHTLMMEQDDLDEDETTTAAADDDEEEEAAADVFDMDMLDQQEDDEAERADQHEATGPQVGRPAHERQAAIDARLDRVVHFGNDAMLPYAAPQSRMRPFPQKALWEQDEWDTGATGHDEGIFYCNMGGRLRIVTRMRNANPTHEHLVQTFGSSLAALRRPFEDKRVVLFRYNSFRAASNVCFECGRLLDSAQIKLLDGFRPMEINFAQGELSKKIARRTLNAGMRLALNPADDPADAYLRRAAGAKAVHEALFRGGANPKKVATLDGANTVPLPFQYVKWVRRWTRRYKYNPTDAPPFDLSVLLRMGLVTPTEYAQVLNTRLGAPRSLSNVSIDVSVGGEYGLVTAPQRPEDAIKRHAAICAEIQKLLAGESLEKPSHEVYEALHSLGVKHHMRLEHLKTGNGALTDAPQFEWHRVVKHTKKRWHPAVAISAERKAATKEQLRSVQQSKFMLTFVLHRRATYAEWHSEHILNQMSASAKRLFEDPLELSRIFKWGLLWRGAKGAWTNWAPRKKGAETTGVGHYVKKATAAQLAAGGVYSKQAYLDAMIDAEPDKLIDRFWIGDDRPYQLKDMQDHPYVKEADGPLFLPDEYMSDCYEDVMLKVHADVGCEIGPVARLFHFHMLLDTKHLSKVQLDQRALTEFFMGCWTGILYNRQYAMTDHNGRPWITPNERPYLQIKLLAEDQIALVMEAYVKKQSLGFMQAAHRAMRRDMEEAAKAAFSGAAARRTASHAAAVVAQPGHRSGTVSVGDGLQTGLRSRADELVNQPAGTHFGRQRLHNATVYDRSNVVYRDRHDAEQAAIEQLDEEEEALYDDVYWEQQAREDASTPRQPPDLQKPDDWPSLYTLNRLRHIVQNNTVLSTLQPSNASAQTALQEAQKKLADAEKVVADYAAAYARRHGTAFVHT
jgi:hypothetical protein